MSIDFIIILLGYGVASFLATTLFVRLGGKCSLERLIRRHIYWFPFMPPLIFLALIGKTMLWLLHAAFEILSRCFEFLSGKKIYRRQKIDYYHRY